MRGLDEMDDRPWGRNPRPEPAGAEPAPATFDTLEFSPNPGELRMLAYVPAGLGPGVAVVAVLHGCGQRAADHAVQAGWLTLADRHGFAVVAPEQTRANNINRCFNWHRPDDTRRGAGEAASIVAMVDAAVARHDLDPGRVFVCGLSAGGAMSLALLAAYPDRFAAGAVIAGVPHAVASTVLGGIRAMRRADVAAASRIGRSLRERFESSSAPRLAIWQGAADEVVDPINADAIAAQWAAACGLAVQPDATDHRPGLTRSVWRSPRSGEVVLERNLVEGLGHGMPVATAGNDGVGTAGPFVLEAGVSAAREICRFWGLAAASPRAAVAASKPPSRPADAPAERSEPPRARTWAIPTRVGADVGRAIRKGLRRLGIR